MECRLVSHRSLVGWTCCAVSHLFWLNILIEHHGLRLSEQLINEGIVMEVDDGYICVSCGKRRKMLSKMRIHLISHGINNEYPCPFCERVLTSQDSRKRHIQTIHKKTLSYKQIRALPKFEEMIYYAEMERQSEMYDANKSYDRYLNIRLTQLIINIIISI